MRNLVILTGSGISADSGMSTFRDSDGLWNNHRIEDVCTHEAYIRDRIGVIEFYNGLRRQLLGLSPNPGHLALVELERHFNVSLITQNVDDLHERAGSTNVIHLHGELRKLRSTADESAVFPIEGWRQDPDMRAPDGSLLRPHIVFFNESVPMFDLAARKASKADIMLVIGTSLAVYPAASLLSYVPEGTPVFIVDPGSPDCRGYRIAEHLRLRGAEGVPVIVRRLIDNYK